MSDKVYEPTHLNKINRLPEKARYDAVTIRAIVQEAHFVNVSFVDEDGYPQCIPMVAAIEETSEELFVYLHGYHKARLVRLLPPESRVCITATLFDGLVLSLSAFHHSINHRSAVLHGEVLDWDEDSDDAQTAKWAAAKNIVNGVLPGRWDESRQPSKAEMTTTGFIKVKVLTASAKVRSGQPGEEKKDVEDDDLTAKTWCGVIPARIAWGQPVPSTHNRYVGIPEHIVSYTSTPGASSG